MIQNKGRVKQSFLSSKVLGKGRGKGTSKKQTINSHLGIFRAFPKVCKLHWVRTQHCSFLSTSVSCIHISRRKALAMIKPLPQAKPAVDPCCSCDKHKIVLHSSYLCQHAKGGIEDWNSIWAAVTRKVITVFRFRWTHKSSPFHQCCWWCSQSLYLSQIIVPSKSKRTCTHSEPGS